MKNMHLSLPSVLFGAIIAFACTVGTGKDDTASAQATGGVGRAVVELYTDVNGDSCSGTYAVQQWSVNGGDCDCPSGFSPVGTATSTQNTVCLED
jgi:hypothetical protein